MTDPNETREAPRDPLIGVLHAQKATVIGAAQTVIFQLDRKTIATAVAAGGAFGVGVHFLSLTEALLLAIVVAGLMFASFALGWFGKGYASTAPATGTQPGSVAASTIGKAVLVKAAVPAVLAAASAGASTGATAAVSFTVRAAGPLVRQHDAPVAPPRRTKAAGTAASLSSGAVPPNTPLDAGVDGGQKDSGGDDADVSADEIGHLNIIAETTRCRVSIDGTVIGYTPIVRVPLGAGPHKLRCDAPQQEPQLRTVNIVNGEVLDELFHFPLSAFASDAGGHGFLNINSLPSSDVMLDGERIGETPKVHLEVSSGTHVVTFVRDGGSRVVSVTVGPGETKTAAVRIGIVQDPSDDGF
jgi:hypothetical protein